jgi:hypothetical protein
VRQRVRKREREEREREEMSSSRGGYFITVGASIVAFSS